MRKKLLAGLATGFWVLGMAGVASATLTTIGTATYNGSDYNLIWDDDNNGNSVVWLDYTNAAADWSTQKSWAAGLNDDLNIHLMEGYYVNWNDAEWRLPNTVDGIGVRGYEGDPDGDGIYSYTYGFNLANAELGHLFYEELGNQGYLNTTGVVQASYGLLNTGDFDNLINSYTYYWSGTEYTNKSDAAWLFGTYYGAQSFTGIDSYLYGLALTNAQVSDTAPVPEPVTILLFGTGLAGLAGSRIRRKKKA